MATHLTILNAALTRTGSEPITSLDDDVAEAKIAKKNYDPIVAAALTSYPWRWATKTATLTLLTDEPDEPWSYAYQLPSDVLFLRVVTVDGAPVDYEVQLDKVLCDQDSGATVVAKYIWDVPETSWPPDFVEALTQAFEVVFLRGVGERYREAADREKAAARTMQAAKTNDARKASPRNPWNSPTLTARGGVSAWPAIPWR